MDFPYLLPSSPKATFAKVLGVLEVAWNLLEPMTFS